MLGKTPEFMNAERVPCEIQQEIYETVSKGNIWTNTVLNKRKDGSTFYNEFSVTPMYDNEGNINSYASIQRDTTDRKLTEEALRESEPHMCSPINHTNM